MTTKILTFALLLFSTALPSLCTPQQVPVLHPRPEEVPILAVADVQPASPEKAAELSEPLKTFNQVLWDDLSFSGFFTMAGKSFYPPRPVSPENMNYDAWNGLAFKVTYLTAGTMDSFGGALHAKLHVFDMKSRSESFGLEVSGDQDQIRAMVHRWADEIVYRLTAGASKGIASTKIAYVSRKGNAKEIYVMDYDGYNAHEFTHNGSLNLFPNWAPDNSKLAFASYRPHPEINIYSYLDGSRIPFPIFNSLAYAPAISPDGTEIAFALRTPRGDTDIFISKLDGSGQRDITDNPAIESSPTWAPSGRQIAFVSDRRQPGISQIYICDADGSNVRGIIKEGGDADSPAWSPDGKWIAFHWKPRLSTTYDIFIADVASGRITQLTGDNGSNEYPSWAPDGRHLAFQSNRTGAIQLYIMLLDSSELRMITKQGNNTSPAWSGYFQRETQK
jgi:TolB protein